MPETPSLNVLVIDDQDMKLANIDVGHVVSVRSKIVPELIILMNAH